MTNDDSRSHQTEKNLRMNTVVTLISIPLRQPQKLSYTSSAFVLERKATSFGKLEA